MPKITDQIREIIKYGNDGVDCKDAEDLLFFVRDSIKEHDEGQLPVDVEWLDKAGRRTVDDPDNDIFMWQFRKRVRVCLEDGSFVLQLDTRDVIYSPTRSDVLNLLRIVGGVS